LCSKRGTAPRFKLVGAVSTAVLAAVVQWQRQLVVDILIGCSSHRGGTHDEFVGMVLSLLTRHA